MDEESLWAAALRRPTPAEGRAFLGQPCGGNAALRQRVKRLPAVDERTHGILSLGPAADLGTSVPAPLTPGTVSAGRFKLHERPGAGGMGEVWVADQHGPVPCRVAVKVIRPASTQPPCRPASSRNVRRWR
jgi:eukaryotic-like serine/threonine-protein kinase